MFIVYLSLAFCAGMLTMGFIQCGTKAALEEDRPEPTDDNMDDQTQVYFLGYETTYDVARQPCVVDCGWALARIAVDYDKSILQY